MPAYLFTYHAYRSWMPDRPQGFVQKGAGIAPPNKSLANVYAETAEFPPVLFKPDIQEILLETALGACERRGWRLHAAAAEPTHVHLLVSWSDQGRWQDVRGKLRNIMSLEISRRHCSTGRPWFSQGASRKRVRDRKHFEHLVRKYLPRHGGVGWFEDSGWVLEKGAKREPRPPGRG